MGIWAEIRDCNACHLRKSMICQPIPGFTKIQSPNVMIVGEAPGINECLIEKPFQGMAGKLLDKMLNSAKVNRDNLYITNLTKCRPTVKELGKKNRPPTKTEISICSVWLEKEIIVVNPKIIFSLGSLPSQFLLKDKNIKITEIVGKEHCIDNRIIIPMLHPSYLLQYSKDNIEEFISIMKKVKVKYEFCKW